MTAWSLAGASLLTHGVHYALVVGGLIGVGTLLAPRLAGRPAPGAPRDEHEVRVDLLRTALATGTLVTPSPSSRLFALAAPQPSRALDATLLLPLAVVASAAAAGVHAAMGPAHFAEQTSFGLFFALSALAQLAWTAAVLQRLTTPLLLAGIVLNAGCVGLWVLTRGWGLPFGLMPRPEAIGAWDLAAVTWEVVVVVACAQLLHLRPRGAVLAPVARWRPAARVHLVASALVLLALSIGGFSG
ncbi:MAG: hypothetical protein F2667_04755 [Actinobacteria bacterium]|uniref:Unannotated protein n=1 Tax=freshwater metagenome TaxID=449393 RepID=A0A6J6PNK8_9ZZZZ|nr:hypothetical protein [Actinomycetota bacterium]